MRCIEGPEAVRRQASDILHDESRYTLGVPRRVCYPESVDDIRTVLAQAAREGAAVTIVGGQTGITGGSVPTEGCTALCLSAMHSIRKVESTDGGGMILRCDPGVTLERVAAFLRDPRACDEGVPGGALLGAGSWFYPPDPTEVSAQLGGTVAANASGARTLRYGPTRNHIELLGVVLAGGETLTVRRGEHVFGDGRCSFITDQGGRYTVTAPRYDSGTLKNASGYFSRPGMDLIDLLVGSEGTLAVFSEVGIRLSPAPRICAGLTFLPSRRSAFSFAEFLRNNDRVLAIEYFDSTVLGFMREHHDAASLKMPPLPSTAQTAIYWEFAESEEKPFEAEVDVWEEVLGGLGGSFDDTWSGFEPEEMIRLKAFRHAAPELVNQQIARHKRTTPSIRKVGTDTAVPGCRFPELFDRYAELIEGSGLSAAVFGHLGNYHLHFNLIPRDAHELSQAHGIYGRMMEIALELGGTVSAEHGIGKLKAEYLARMYGTEGIADMRRVKQAVDPAGLLNPGNLFAPSR